MTTVEQIIKAFRKARIESEKIICISITNSYRRIDFCEGFQKNET